VGRNGRADLRPGAVRPRFKRWLLKERIEGPETREAKERQQSWWKVVCLTDVDYFSTLGYIPGIAALAVGALAHSHPAHRGAHPLCDGADVQARRLGEPAWARAPTAMLERLLSFWPGKLMVLALLGFIATDFMITITLSASDAAVHFAENPLVPSLLDLRGARELGIRSDLCHGRLMLRNAS
jgi:hypothetical protein